MEKNFLTSIKEFFANIKRDQVLALIAVICAIVCVILCAACLVSVTKATKGIETVVQEVQEMKQASTQLTERIIRLETVVDNTQTALNESVANRYINITLQRFHLCRPHRCYDVQCCCNRHRSQLCMAEIR